IPSWLGMYHLYRRYTSGLQAWRWTAVLSSAWSAAHVADKTAAAATTRKGAFNVLKFDRRPTEPRIRLCDTKLMNSEPFAPSSGLNSACRQKVPRIGEPNCALWFG